MEEYGKTSVPDHEETLNYLIDLSHADDRQVVSKGECGDTNVFQDTDLQNSEARGGKPGAIDATTMSPPNKITPTKPTKLITEDLVKMTADLQCVMEELEKSKAKIMENQETIQKLNDAIDIERETKEKLEEQVARQSGELEAMGRTANNQKQQLTDLGKEKDRMEKELNEKLCLKQKTIDELNLYLDKNTETFTTLKSENKQKDTQIEEMSQKSHQLENTVHTLERMLKDSEKNVQQLLNDIVTKSHEVAEAMKFDQDQKSSIKLLTLRIDEMNKTKEHHKAELQLQHQMITQKEKMIQELKEEVQMTNIKIYEMSKSKEEMSQRLSEEWSRKVSSDESNIENISIKNRPMNVASEYQQLCAHQWLDAKNTLDEKYSDEETKQITLCEILKEAEQIAIEKYKTLMQNIMVEVLHARNNLGVQKDVSSQESKEKVKVTTGECMECRCTHTDITTRKPVSEHIPMETDQSDAEANLQQETNNGDPSSTHILAADGKTTVQSAVDMQPLSNRDMVDREDIASYEIKRPPNVCPAKDVGCENTSVKQQDLTDRQIDIQTSQQSHQETENTIDIPDLLSNALGDYLRLTADDTDVGSITKALLVFLEAKCQAEKQWLSEVINHTKIRNYVDACAKLAWKMILQRPSMTFSIEGEYQKWDEKSQEPTYGCHDPKHPQAIVMYYVTPTLLHADRVMAKGKVMIKI